MHSRPSTQGFRHIFKLAILVLSGLCCGVPVGGALGAEISIHWSFPQVGDWIPPPADLVEGGLIATFTGDQPITPLNAVDGLEPLDATTWTYTFTWDWSEPLIVDFLADDGDTVHIEATPARVIPFGSVMHDLPVFHIQTEAANLWSPDSGLYVYGNNANFQNTGHLWERSATLDYYPTMDNLAFSEPVGLRINGGWSRRFDQKSFRFYFDDYGQSDTMQYDFFDGPPVNFQRLILRTHRFPFNCVNSDLLEQIFLDQGHLGSRIMPAVAYVNDEYWGLYSLREKVDDEFVEITHGLGADGYTLVKDGETTDGDPLAWTRFIDGFGQDHHFQSRDWYAQVETQLDIGSYLDWLILNIFSASADNGFNGNLAQVKLGDEPWRIIMWDEDDTFFADNLETNMFRYYAATTEAEFNTYKPNVYYYGPWGAEQQQWCTMFNRLLQNSQFKARFFDRLAELMSDPLSPDGIATRIEALVNPQLSETERQAQRWNWNHSSDLHAHADILKRWVEDRTIILQQQIETFRHELRQPLDLAAFSAIRHDTGVELSWETRAEQENLGFMVLRQAGDEVELIGSYETNDTLVGKYISDGPVTYHLNDPSPVAGQVNQYHLLWVPDGQAPVELPWQESLWIADWNGLEITELMADNASTVTDGAEEFDDWFEIYNGSSVVTQLDGCYLTDDLNNPTCHQLQGNFALPPGAHLLLWADSQPQQGRFHCDFKLSSDGEGIYLLAPDAVTIISQVEFGPQVADVAWARHNDQWVYSAHPSPGFANGDPATHTLLNFNELMVENQGCIVDDHGDYDAWLEIINPLPVPMSLDGCCLVPGGLTDSDWDLTGLDVPAASYLVLWLDGQPEQGLTHSPFTMDLAAGSITLVTGQRSQPADDLAFYNPGADQVLARIPDGHGPWLESVFYTPGSLNYLPQTAQLVINEFMAKNNTTITDEMGSYEDWVEIYNAGNESVNLQGLFLSDDLNQTTQWPLPDVTLAAGDFLLVWCDDDPTDGPLHATFKLSAGGEDIALFASLDQGNYLIDSRTFGPQAADFSEGRQSNGGPIWTTFVHPTPGTSNLVATSVTPTAPRLTGLLPNYPNPFNPSTSLAFDLSRTTEVELAIHDLRGRKIIVLADGMWSAGRHVLEWQGQDAQGRQMSSGVYLVRLRTDVQAFSRRITLVK